MEYHKEGYEPEVIVSDDSSILSCEANDKSLLSFTTTPQGGRDSLETTPTLSRHPSSETPSRESMDDPVGVDDVELESSHRYIQNVISRIL